MARPRKSLDLQSKHLTQEEKSEKEVQENLIKADRDQLDKVPTWLGKEGKKEWKRLVKELKAINIVCNLDYNNLMAYCDAYEEYLLTAKQLKNEPKIIEYTNKAGITNKVQNPLLKIKKDNSDEMKKYAALLGLTIDSRLKIATIKSTETKSEIVNEFGDI